MSISCLADRSVGGAVAAPTDIAAFELLRPRASASVIGVSRKMHRSARDPTRGLYARFRSLALVVSVLASAVVADRAAVGQEAKSDSRSELVVTKLPPRGSRAYKDLLGLAGREANGQVLGFTQSEVWSMPSSHIDDVI